MFLVLSQIILEFIFLLHIFTDPLYEAVQTISA